MCAYYRATLELCQVLLGAGANPNKKNVVGETPLLKAVSCQHCRSMLGLTGSKDTDVHIEVNISVGIISLIT